MQIDLRDIDYFLACAMHGRVTLAAEALDVGSPVVIEAIRRLEEEFNIELLTPACRHSSLTPWALNFADAVRGLSAGYADAVRVISEMKSQKTSVLRIGFPDPGRARQMALPLSTLLREQPGLRP
ncbi:LysR family transcriptional regulator [Verminephrobacter eiseniae]|uniref:Transcriptional regulator, LysR family n=1 Tax=Verminephrobacter eiseniae (strain EF01-2) TaxID=391735 RepID=A1WRP1_VEREI|nr:LysR family transcriptional regulator [Verminephrobacter eiseniae]ABM60298.1 transcriptional regulator, LysR family [Verminephrobacter eiseniae EF01-2]MCW5285783.1 LysR family transcriptional regulator [Verminephrobacter eiseniae]MCW5304081.1 LysR family transcriptional regulator [Verminephrobacter eiseniae]MCW8180609.1 LysR family transcriptional regulator [Verminephrobacter eiseniae]MCW8191172.1 LysR family transcriptional regulator [Verminephrobacter eiseniae]